MNSHTSVSSFPSQPYIENILITPFFQQIDITAGTAIDPDIDEMATNYKSYDLFCLKTRLLFYLKSTETVQFKKVLLKDRMMITIDILDGAIEQDLDKKRKYDIQSYIDDICEDIIISKGRNERPTCLVYYYNHNMNIPEEYQRLIISHLEIEKMNDSEFTKISIINDKVFARLPEIYNKKSYQAIYQELNDKIVKLLQKAYNNAYIPCDEEFTKRWDLIKVNKTLCKPCWDYPLFIPDKAKFLFDRYKKTLINIPVPRNTSFYHLVAMYISPVTFVSGNIQFEPKNIKEVYEVYTVIDYLKSQDYSFEVKTIRYARIPDKLQENSVVYTLSDGLFPIVVSYKY